MHTKQVLTVFISIVIVMLVIYLSSSISLNPVTAQSTSSLKDFIAQLENRVKEENGFTFSIVLAHSANPNFLEISIGSEDGFTISDIGSDYVCVNRLAGAALVKGCYPFTNIASISFLEN
ncbi:MAG: hypothetical protein ABI835_11985 [Chloroflexota bacterium]